MSTVRVTSGSCGFKTTINVTGRGKGKPYSVAIESDCESVEKMAAEIKQLNRMDAFAGFMQNPVYQAAARNLKHVSCIVPAGILMALEVEAGFNLPVDAGIEFIDATAAGSSEG